MRVVSGLARGKALKAVPGSRTMPILDRVKTALFDILRPRISHARVLDLFAGSGSVGIEALSQGAAYCVFLDIDCATIKIIKENLDCTNLNSKAEVRNTDAFSFIRNSSKQFDLIYVAPPQYRGIWIEIMHELAAHSHILSATGEIIVQIDPKEYEALQLAEFTEVQQRKYGNTLLVFYGRAASNKD